MRNAWCSFRKFSYELNDRPSALLKLKIRALKVEVPEKMLYDWVRACHHDTRRRAHFGFPTRSIG